MLLGPGLLNGKRSVTSVPWPWRGRDLVLISCLYISTVTVPPSLDLHPSTHHLQFSHHPEAEVTHKEVQTEESEHITLSRDVYTQEDVDKLLYREETKTSYWTRVKSSMTCSRDCMFHTVTYFLPILYVVRKYRIKQFIISDLASGVSAACLHFPQGLAYGILASLSPAQGLYSSFFPVLFYSVFGMSHHMAMGTDAVIAIITAETVDTEAEKMLARSGNHTNATSAGPALLQYKTSVAACCTLICGLLLAAMGICRLGFLTTYQSKSFIGGFTTAAAFQIFTSQIAQALGIKIPVLKGLGKAVMIYKHVIQGISKTHLPTVIITLICVVVIVFIKDFINVRYKEKLIMPVPADLLVIIMATFISEMADLQQFNIDVVGYIPTGIPPPAVPNVSVFTDVMWPSLQMTMITFSLTIAMAKLLAEKHEYEINDNQEIMAYGMMNFCSSFFGCFPACTSPPRSMVLSAMGSKTTLNGLFTAFALLMVLMGIGPLFSSLPVACLSAMICVSVKPLLLQVRCLPVLYKVNKYDFTIWISSCVCGILLGLPYGLFCGIGTSLFVVVLQSQYAKVGTLVHSTVYQLFLPNDRSRFQNFEHDEIQIFRMTSPLYFATSERFRKNLYRMTVNPLLIPHASSEVSSTLPISINLSRIDSTIKYSSKGTSIAQASYTNREPSNSTSVAQATFSNRESSNNTSFAQASYTNRDSSKSSTVEQATHRKATSISGTSAIQASYTNPEDVVFVLGRSSLFDTFDSFTNDEDSAKSIIKVKFIIIDCSGVAYMDVQGISVLSVVFEEYRRVGITVFLSGCTPFVWRILNRSDFFDVVSKDHVFYQIEDAFHAAKQLLS